MTRLLRDPTDISNYIDSLTDGIGARGSSFRDVDRLTLVHNGGGAARFLFQELKWRDEWEGQTQGQVASLEWAMSDLAQSSESFSVWRVIVEPDMTLTVKDYRSGVEKRLTPEQYRAAFQKWWFPKATGAA